MALLATGGAAAQSAAELFAEGNALVRSGVYRTALLRYQEAVAAGLDTSLLHYNLGVAHYRLGQYRLAADEFSRAAADPDLAALAHYNRGLAQRADGDSAAAQSSFTAASREADARSLRRLAATAAQAAAPRTSSTESVPTRRVARSAYRQVEPVGELRIAAAARVGRDDNVYRSPSAPYVDLADPAQPLVTPVPQSASFMPVDLLAAYVLHNEAGDTDFVFRYDLNGDFYAAEFANANRVSQQLSIGADILLGERQRRRRTLSTAFYARDHSESNFDPDSGVDREIDGVDISDRFSYRAPGVEGEFGQRLGPWSWGFEMRFERREYTRVAPLYNYDHDYFSSAVDIDYDFSDVMTLKLGVLRYQRSYDERPARDLTGALLSTSPPQRFDYSGVQLGLTRRLGRSMELDVDYLRLERADAFLGYYDYTQDVLRLRAIFRPRTRFYLSVGAVARTYDYPNAFAFNVPTAGPRELDELDAELHGEFRLSRHFTLWAELRTDDVTSTDARADYARTQSAIGAEWRRR